MSEMSETEQAVTLEPCPWCGAVSDEQDQWGYLITHKPRCYWTNIHGDPIGRVRVNFSEVGQWNTRRASVVAPQGDAEAERRSVLNLIKRFQREDNHLQATINALEWLRRQIAEGNHVYHKFEQPAIGFAKPEECARCGLPGNALMHLLAGRAATPVTAPADALETQEFYDLMQSYRHTSAIDQAKVCERFEAVKMYLRNAPLITAPVSTGEPRCPHDVIAGLACHCCPNTVAAATPDGEQWTDEFPQVEEALYWVRHKYDHADIDIARLRNGSLYPTDGGPMSRSRRRDREYLGPIGPANTAPPSTSEAIRAAAEEILHVWRDWLDESDYEKTVAILSRYFGKGEIETTLEVDNAGK